MPTRETYVIDEMTLMNLRLLNCNNSVLIRIDAKNTERKTKGGIIVVGDTDFNKADHAERSGTIVWKPDYLNTSKMDWGAVIEVKVGDKVWFDYMTGLNCQGFDVDGVEYKIMHYEDLYMAKRNEKAFPLNGYCLFELVDAEITSKYIINNPKKDARYGIGKYMSEPNTFYKEGLYYDDEMVKEGCKAIFGLPPILLEDELHQEFGGDKLRLSQRKYVLGVDNSGEVYPTKGNVVIKPDKPKEKTESGLFIPLKDIKKVDTGVVVRSGFKGLRKGSRVHFPPDVQGSSYVPDKKRGTVYLTRGQYVDYKF